jgi:cytoskeletal protein CcmA (bactofilin family)
MRGNDRLYFEAISAAMGGGALYWRGIPRWNGSAARMTHIGPSVVFDGDLTSDEDITIDGRLVGSLHARNAIVTVGRHGHVEASLRATRIIVHGTVQGSISASERIELASSAVVTGDLSATQVIVFEGARLNGHVDMGRRTIATRVAQYMADHQATVV